MKTIKAKPNLKPSAYQMKTTASRSKVLVTSFQELEEILAEENVIDQLLAEAGLGNMTSPKKINQIEYDEDEEDEDEEREEDEDEEEDDDLDEDDDDEDLEEEEETDDDDEDEEEEEDEDEQGMVRVRWQTWRK
jgi:hypothetical protein